MNENWALKIILGLDSEMQVIKKTDLTETDILVEAGGLYTSPMAILTVFVYYWRMEMYYQELVDKVFKVHNSTLEKRAPVKNRESRV